ncbi:MAG: hypothetical protein JWO10_1266 [Microbacteriaceae bacterium]|nr:hypothetical protein [Microbacteriaceae bacterium]
MAGKIPWWDRLNNALIPYIGPPQLGPYETEPAVHDGGCPICGRPMAGHEIERRAGRATQMHCPLPELLA